MKIMETPKLCHLTGYDFEHVYEPAEDTYLMMDALEKDLPCIRLAQPAIIVEVCSGSGIINTALARALGKTALFISTDVNEFACKASRDTFRFNEINTFQVICADLLSNLTSGVVDVLICNPPYVPTTEEELTNSDKLALSWAGGKDGRQVMNRLFSDVPRLLSPEGIFYLLVLKENRPSEIIDLFHDYDFISDIIMSRKAGREHLFVLKFSRKKF